MQPFTLDGRARLALGEAVELRLEQLGRRARRAAAATGASQPSWRSPTRRTRLTGLDLRWGDARLRAAADLGRAEVAAEASLDALPLALLGRFGAPPLRRPGGCDPAAQRAGRRPARQRSI